MALDRWFKEKWKKYNEEGELVECGADEGKDDAYCRPTVRVSEETPTTWSELSKEERKKARQAKMRANRQGKDKTTKRFSRIKKKAKGE